MTVLTTVAAATCAGANGRDRRQPGRRPPRYGRLAAMQWMRARGPLSRHDRRRRPPVDGPSYRRCRQRRAQADTRGSKNTLYATGRLVAAWQEAHPGLRRATAGGVPRRAPARRERSGSWWIGAAHGDSAAAQGLPPRGVVHVRHGGQGAALAGNGTSLPA